MTDVTNQLLLETLKKMQADLADLKRGDRDIKTEILSLRAIMAESIRTDVRREGDFMSLELRIERIEKRLELTDTSP